MKKSPARTVISCGSGGFKSRVVVEEYILYLVSLQWFVASFLVERILA